MKHTARPFLISLIILIAAVLVSVLVGSVFIPPATLLDLIKSAIQSSTSTLDPNGTFAAILFQLRTPRAILLILVGASLAGSGSGLSRFVPQSAG
jgi:ABC-type Fe3+-siderophore transport system permease subunit